MDKLTWSVEYAVGVEILDRQHRQVMGVINRLIDDLHHGARDADISDRLAEFADYASEHFRTEEDILAQHGYPALAEQKASHTEYHDWLVATVKALIQRDPDVAWSALDYAFSWWRQHILTEDQKYREFLAERPDSG